MNVDELFREHEATLRRVCARIVGDGDADDMVQETLIRAMTTPLRAGDPRPWLTTVARNLSLNHLRRARRLVFEEVESVTDEPTPRAAAAVLTAIDVLPATERNVVFLRELVDLSPAETAAVLGLSPASVRVLHARARRTLELRPSDADPVASTRGSIDALDQFVTWLLTRVVVGLEHEPQVHLAAVLHGHLALADAILERAREIGPEMYARALLCRGNIRRVLTQYAAAEADLCEALSVVADPRLAATIRLRYATVLGYTSGSGRALEEVGRVLAFDLAPGERLLAQTLRAELLLHEHRWEEARVEIESIESIGPGGDSWERLAAILQIGHAHLVTGRYDRAIAVYGDAVELAARRTDSRGLGAAENNLGMAFHAIGDFVAARARLDVALESARVNVDRRLEGMVLGNIAMVEQETGQLAEASVTYLRAMQIHAEVGNRRNAAVTRFNAAVCEQARGHAGHAVQEMRAARDELEAVGHTVMLPYAAVFLAGAEIEAGEPGAASRLSAAQAWASSSEEGACAAAAGVLFSLADHDRGRLERADLRHPEVKTAMLLVNAALDREKAR